MAYGCRVSIPSSRVGTDLPTRRGKPLRKFPSPQVGSELIRQEIEMMLEQVSIPSSRVGTMRRQGKSGR